MKTYLQLFFLISTFNFYSQSVASINDYNRVLNKINNNKLELESEIIGNATLPMVYKFKNEKLILNGAGLKKHEYACGLYLEIPKTDAKTIVNADEFMIFRMDLLNKKSITSDKISKIIKKSFIHSNSPIVISSLTSEMEYFLEKIEAVELRYSDKIDIVYDPLQGVSLYINYEKMLTIKGLAFKKAIFNIWLSHYSMDQNLKKELLNGAGEYF